MLQNLYEELAKLLESNERYLVDGMLSKDKVAEDALAMDSDLLKALTTNESIKNHFFGKVGTILIFDKVKFQKFVLNKDFLPDNYTAFRNKVGMNKNDEFITESNDVVLVWPYKDCVLEGGQDEEDAKRAEIFWNLTLAPDQITRLLSPKALSNFEKYDDKGKKIALENVTEKDNLLIKGNNLLALHTLKGKYRNKIKLIYIDPPYNPDSKNNTFTYNNSFNRSTWLTFMKNRLEVAREFLSPDGSLIIAIDENEQAHLGVLLKEMFRDYEIHCITIVHNPRGTQAYNFSYTHEYAFFVIPRGRKSIGARPKEKDEVNFRNFRRDGLESERNFAKNCFYPILIQDGEIIGFGDVCKDDEHPKKSFTRGKITYVYPIDSNNVERKWGYARQTVAEISDQLRCKESRAGEFEIEMGRTSGRYKTHWIDSRYDANAYGTKLLNDLVPNAEFLFPKSLWNVYDCLYAIVGEDPEAIVMDFFAGSGTTAHAVLEMNKSDDGNRKFILCEQMDYVETVTKARIREVIKRNGKDSFVYAELLAANEQFVEMIRDAGTIDELQNIWNEMQERAFLSYRANSVINSISKISLSGLDKKEFKTFLLEILDHNMLYVPYSEMEDEQFGIDQNTQEINQKMFG